MRKKWTPKAVEALLNRRKTFSGTDSAYCKSIDIAQSQYYRLKGGKKKQTVSMKTDSAGIVQLMASSRNTENIIEITSPLGYKVKVTGPDAMIHLANILAWLGQCS